MNASYCWVFARLGVAVGRGVRVGTEVLVGVAVFVNVGLGVSVGAGAGVAGVEQAGRIRYYAYHLFSSCFVFGSVKPFDIAKWLTSPVWTD